MTMSRLLTVLSCSLVWLPAPAVAQVANPSALIFRSTDHTAVIPAGSVGAGQPAVASYQAFLFSAPDDVTQALPISTGPVLAKATVTTVAGTTPQDYRLTLAQILPTGLPACATQPCPQYTLVLVSIGPGGTSARAISAESDSFTAALPPPTPAPVPAGPTTLRVQ